MNIPSKNPEELLKQLNNFHKGILKNKHSWPKNNTPIEMDIEKVSLKIEKLILEINSLENDIKLSRKVLNKIMNEEAKKIYVKIRDQAYSLYGKRSEKLKDFNLKILNK
ncbi:MAG TPA: hypothetical protein PLG90_10265 [Ignavibacteria bacterium]|nr:hypothetical protein [Ignavibacteria bacterium]